MILRAVESRIKFSLRHLKPDWNNFVPTIDTGGSALRNKYVFSLRRIEGIFAITIFFFFFPSDSFYPLISKGKKNYRRYYDIAWIFSLSIVKFSLKGR